MRGAKSAQRPIFFWQYAFVTYVLVMTITTDCPRRVRRKRKIQLTAQLEPELFDFVEWFAVTNGTSLSIAGAELIRIARLATYAN